MSEQKRHDLAYLSVDSITPNEWNPQGMDDDEFDRLVEEIDEVGFNSAIEVVEAADEQFVIMGGEHRWRAAKVCGLEHIPCLIYRGEKWEEADLQKFVTVRLNVIGGKLDPIKFAKIYEEMAEKYGKDSLQHMFAFTDQKAFQRLVGDVKKGLKGSLPKELQDEFDEAAKEAKTVEDLSKIIQNLFNKYGDTVQHSFMVFTFGKQHHVYIQMSSKTKKALDKVLGFCKTMGEDINEVMAPIIKACADDAEKKLADGYND
jgi:hypothetical protein